MSKVFQSVTKFDPISHAFSPGGKADILKPKVAAPPPAYDPSKNPGTQLFAPPPGGALTAAPGSLFGGGAPSTGYAPNPWQKSVGGPSPPTSLPGGGVNGGQTRPLWSGMPGGSPPGTPQVAMPPPNSSNVMSHPGQIAPGQVGQNPALQRQIMMAQNLRAM